MSNELSVLNHPKRCQALYSKGLFINAGCKPGEEITGDGNFWCAKTQTIMGPDRQLCGGEYCLDEGRGCYEGL